MSGHQDDGDLGGPRFARSAIGGKKTAKCEARISDETKFALTRRCDELGMTESDYLDRLLCVSLFGLDHVLSVERMRTEKVIGLSAVAPEPIGAERAAIIESARSAAESIKPWSVHQCPYPQGTAAAALWIQTFIAARGRAEPVMGSSAVGASS